jgi:ribA/ribD-fused uncharacterized protein
MSNSLTIQNLIDFPANHPLLVGAAVTAATSLITGSLIVGVVAAGALYLISKSFASAQPVATTQKQPDQRIAQLAKRDGFVWFYKKDENPATEVFGNFYESPLNYNGRTYRCAEAAFQAQKFLGDEQQQFEKLDGDGAWRRARELSKGWDKARTDGWRKRNLTVMADILQAKFSTDPLKSILLSTEKAYLVEHIPVKGRDSFYGDDSDGTGQNMLGKLIMDVREKLGGTGRVNAPAKYLQNVTKLK